MPRLHVLAVSARLPAWAEQACAQYAKRMPKGYEVARLDVKAELKKLRQLEKKRDEAEAKMDELLKEFGYEG